MKFEALQKTPIFDSLSTVGKRMFQPNGIFYWSKRAKKEAKINATIGTAMGYESDIIPDGRSSFIPYYLPDINSFIQMEPERMTAYAPVSGIAAFRKIWKQWIEFKGQHAYNLPSGIRDVSPYLTTPMICNGITNAIYIVSRLFLNPGEKIICPNKRWGNYNLVLKQQNELEMEYYDLFSG